MVESVKGSAIITNYIVTDPATSLSTTNRTEIIHIIIHIIIHMITHISQLFQTPQNFDAPSPNSINTKSYSE